MIWRKQSCSRPVPGNFLAIVGQDPSDCNPIGYMLTSSGFALFD